MIFDDFAVVHRSRDVSGSFAGLIVYISVGRRGYMREKYLALE